jgi:hypothetical protein
LKGYVHLQLTARELTALERDEQRCNDDPSKDALLGVVIDGQRKLITFSPAREREIVQYRATVEGDKAEGCMPF